MEYQQQLVYFSVTMLNTWRTSIVASLPGQRGGAVQFWRLSHWSRSRYSMDHGHFRDDHGQNQWAWISGMPEIVHAWIILFHTWHTLCTVHMIDFYQFGHLMAVVQSWLNGTFWLAVIQSYYVNCGWKTNQSHSFDCLEKQLSTQRNSLWLIYSHSFLS